MSYIVKRARELAHRAHAGQVDKAGRPYIEHVERVAERVLGDGRCSNEDCNGHGEVVHWDTVHCGDPACCSPATSPCPECDVAEAVAWLHDVLEDATPEFCQELIEFPSRISMTVADLTRAVHGEDPQYYPIIRSNPIALRVKLADIADNMDEERLALLDPKTANRLRRKYKQALKALGAE